MYVFAYMYICAPHVSSAWRGQKRATNSPELKLKTITSCHMSAGNQIWVLWMTTAEPCLLPQLLKCRHALSYRYALLCLALNGSIYCTHITHTFPLDARHLGADNIFPLINFSIQEELEVPSSEADLSEIMFSWVWFWAWERLGSFPYDRALSHGQGEAYIWQLVPYWVIPFLCSWFW